MKNRLTGAVTRFLAAAAGAVAVAAAEPPPTEPPVAANTETTSQSVWQRAIHATGPVHEARFLRVEGRITSNEGTTRIQFLSSLVRPRRLVIRQTLPDLRVMEMGCHGDLGWLRSPIDGTVKPMEATAVVAASAGLIPTNMMFALADRFPHRQLGPIEMDHGVPCRRLELEDRDGIKGSAWFDERTGQLRRLRTLDRDPLKPATELSIDAWKTLGTLSVPCIITIQTGNQVTRSEMTSISLEPIPDSEFAPPKELQAIATD